jgi:hypothetical protein
MNENEKISLPIGVEDFGTVASQCYYVDKSLLIKEMIDRVDGSVTLFTRPRRFGKSLSLSMLDYFFSISHKKDAKLFTNLAIGKEGEPYLSKQGEYPLIHFNFKNVSGLTFHDEMGKISQAVSEEADKHNELLNSPRLNQDDKDLFIRLRKGEATESELSSGARLLSELLYKHYGRKAIILIDEYDAPIERAREHGYYDKAISFFRSFYGESLKGNSSLRFAALTGVLQISKESLFSDLNNLVVDSVLSGAYSEYFGFTEVETEKMLDYYGYSSKYQEVKTWYNGYRFGNTMVYNPWSVINYIFYKGEADAYWVDTGENALFAELLFPKNMSHNEALVTLLSHKQVKINVANSLAYQDLSTNDNALFSFLLATGYLTWKDKDPLTDERTLLIPNLETAKLFQNEVIKRYATFQGENWPGLLRTAFQSQDEETIANLLMKYIVSGFSCFDYGLEKNYQCLLLGMASVLFSDANVTSEVNAGEGRCDILINPKDKNKLGIIIETKNNVSKQSAKTLESSAATALKQIESRDYQEILRKDGVKNIIAYGISFHKTKAKILSKKLA